MRLPVRRARALPAAVLIAAGSALAGCATGGPAASSSTSSPPGLSTTTSAAPAVSLAPYEPVWPFRTWADVVSWEQEHRATGLEPWHLVLAATATRFTTGFLGFRDVGVVLATTTKADGAHVSVGFSPAPGRTSTAAVVHLVRWGSSADSPWEVVGTDDTTFSMTMPHYGAAATSPLRVGGAITGVDERIRVTVLEPSSARALGTFCCQPAGGSDSPWSATVSYSGATDPVLTVVASTGGHVQSVERFTVTAVRSGR